MDNKTSIFDPESILKTEEKPDKILEQITQAIAIMLQADRCFLYVRDPQTRYGQAAFCYCRNPEVKDVSSNKWEQERPEDLEAKDPMFAAALNCKPSIYVEDVETADPRVLNRDFEAKEFGHRALIHAHLCQGDRLWGIWQPCIFDRPRHWTTGDKTIMDTIVSQTTPLVKQYVLNNIQSIKQKDKKS